MFFDLVITQEFQGSGGTCGNATGTFFTIAAQTALLRNMSDEWSINYPKRTCKSTALAADTYHG
jgi:hypothetical protein